MKKVGFFRNVLDTIRSNQATGPGGRGGPAGAGGERAIEFGGQLKQSHFALCQVARHGFPEQPTALAFDPVQKIAAIGTKSGAIRIFGRPGVDVWAQHEPAFPVTHMKFIVNQGALITVTADETVHLWSLRGPNLRLQFSANTQGAAGTSPQASSPAPTPAANISSTSPQSGNSSTLTTSAAGVTSAATSPSSFLGQITDTVTGAVDSASDFLSGAVDNQATPSPTNDNRNTASRRPEISQQLKFREHITCIHQTLTSKWLYVGTDKGNLYVVNVETFQLSGYSIAWNKAIELSRKTHPGAIIQISECPQDTNKLLIGYESGCIVIWDLKQKNADGRYYCTENLLWLAWHYEGKQFVAAHGDGSLITWQTRSNARPAQILHPHAKTASSGSTGGFDTNQPQQQSLSSTFARSLNNELYRPINKVEWKISKSTNEPFYLFSGGLPYDGYDQAPLATAQDSNLRPATANPQHQRQPASLSASSQILKASSATPGVAPTPSPISPSPNWPHESSSGNKARRSHQLPKDKKSLRSTSLTVMFGKSITVLEMDDTIIDFITICDNSPYENDTSEPSAVIVLLSNELILIDLTSSGYPSFDSPYPSASLSESPVTCVQYLADCSSDLIPFLYSTSQNVISRAPKKGFSDKEWPINGGEWGQSMQSYPELVLTGHADGTIKFWDMSGVNFDLISKIKTSKLFEKPSKPPNAVFISSKRSQLIKPGSPSKFPSNENEQYPSLGSGSDQSNNRTLEETLFAIEKIEFCSTTKRLLVAGAYAQVIQFKLNKKDTHPSSASAVANADLTTIFVEPNFLSAKPAAPEQGQHNLQWKPHCLFQMKGAQGGSAGSSSGGSSSSSNSHRGRGLSGFIPELVCLTPLLVSTSAQTENSSTTRAIYCQIPPKITALAFQATHNILAYGHESGIVLIDIIQKCVIINATLSDLYGGSLPNSNNRDISIQPYATSSILQHHYQGACSSNGGTYGSGSDFGTLGGTNNQVPSADNCTAAGHHQQQQQPHNRIDLSGNERTTASAATNKNVVGGVDGAQLVSPSRTAQSVSAAAAHSATSSTSSASTAKQPVQSRYTNSMFQRQLSTNALNINANAGSSNASTSGPSSLSNSTGPTTIKHAPRLFQRQMTASQLFSGGSAAASGPQDTINCGGKNRLLSSVRADANLAGSAACLVTSTNQAISAAAAASGTRPKVTGDAFREQAGGKKPPKNKRIISRMLSISAIHTTVGSNSSADESVGASPQMHSGSHLTGSGSAGTGCLSDDTNQSNDTPTIGGTDKFDSSFRRSRSSSTSSTAGALCQQQQTGDTNSQQHGQESIQSIAFLDPAQATPTSGPYAPSSGASSSGSGSGAQVGGGSSTASGATGASSQAALSTGLVQSSAGPNHKSLGSIDNQSGQLALWLGTSTGSLLLVCLQMPDSEDNRILQLQSINAEPIPQASIKLNGQILCVMPFTCEARLQLGSSSSATSGSTGAGQASSSSGFQSASQSSSLEGDTLMHSPGSSGSAPGQIGGGAMAGVASSSGAVSSGGGSGAGSSTGPPGGSLSRAGALESASNVSFDTRSSLFFAIVSEKQARIYQVPPGHLLASGSAGAALGSGSRSSTTDHHHHHHHHHGHQGHLTSSTSSMTQLLQESPLGQLLTSKKNLVAECELSESSFACRSAVVQMRSPDESCLVSYLASGNIVVHSLPRLRPILMDADFVPYSSARISSSMRLSRQGHCLYQPSPGEICKFTISSQYRCLVNEMMGLVYVPHEMPEMPRTNFFKSLFSVSQSARQSDRDELFGECSSGRPSRGVAKHVGGPSASASGLEKLKSAAVGTMGHDVRMAREGLDERGEKLSEIEDRTLAMLNQSETYSQAAHQLAQRFKDKKWYQF